MSAIKLKNQIVRALNAAVAEARLPAGVTFEATLKDRRIAVRIMATPFDVLKPGKITLGDGYCRYTVSLMAGPEADHTAEGCKLLADAQAIVKSVCPQGARVWFAGEAYNAQGRRMRDALAQARAVAV